MLTGSDPALFSGVFIALFYASLNFSCRIAWIIKLASDSYYSMLSCVIIRLNEFIACSGRQLHRRICHV